MAQYKTAIERFVQASKQPVLCEPGEELLEIRPESFCLDERNGGLVLQAWDERRNLVRRVTGIQSETRSKLVLRIERFGKKAGTLSLVDMLRTDTGLVERRASRLEFRETFRRFLKRDFPEFKLVELTTEPNLEHSLSPAYPRAFLRQGSTGLAAIAAAPESNCDDALSFGLIWLDYLRRRENGVTVRGLILFLPLGRERNCSLRLKFLNRNAAHFSIYTYTEDQEICAVDIDDSGNVDTQLEPCVRRGMEEQNGLEREISAWSGVQCVATGMGNVSFRINGLEFAKTLDGRLWWGLETRRIANTSNLREIRAFAEELLRVRSADATDRRHPLYLRNRESWLESKVRLDLEQLDAGLCPDPVYGQVPAFAAGDRGVLDLLAIDRGGRLAVIELKASQDIHLPLQALDYWIRVKWHLDRSEFTKYGYFPSKQVSGLPPRLLLVAPSLEFHPTNERILRFFSPQVQVERIGIGLEWQKQLRIMYRMCSHDVQHI
jgi:hypothetical protein